MPNFSPLSTTHFLQESLSIRTTSTGHTLFHRKYLGMAFYTPVLLLYYYVLKNYDHIYENTSTSEAFNTLKRFRKCYFTGWNLVKSMNLCLLTHFNFADGPNLLHIRGPRRRNFHPLQNALHPSKNSGFNAPLHLHSHRFPVHPAGVNPILVPVHPGPRAGFP